VKYKSAVPVIATSDLLASLDFCANTLGFEKHFVFGDPPAYAGVKRDDVLRYLAHDPCLADMIRQNELSHDLFLWVNDVDAVYEEHKARGARIVEDIANRPWDARQYVVEDPNGYRLKIAEPIDEIKSAAASC